MNNPKRNHHVIPKQYLKGFVIDKGETSVWVYERGTPYNPGEGVRNNPRKRTIKVAGVERDFYADPKDDGGQDFETFENELEKLEKPADPIFGKIRAKLPITKEEKSVFSSYIIQMQRRVVSGREQVRKQLASHPYQPSNEFFEKANLQDTPEMRAELKILADKITQKPGFDIQAHNRITAAAPGSLLIEALKGMTWSFYIVPTAHAFVTNDNPVFIPEPFGLGKNISELSFPISSEIALVASWNDF